MKEHEETLMRAYQALGENYDSMFSLLSAYLIRQTEVCTFANGTPPSHRKIIEAFFYLLENPEGCLTSIPQHYSIDAQQANVVHTTLHQMVIDSVLSAYIARSDGHQTTSKGSKLGL